MKNLNPFLLIIAICSLFIQCKTETQKNQTISAENTVKYAKETVGLGTCIPQRYVKSEEKDKANFLYAITAPGSNYFRYHTTFTSMKETFGYKTPEAWFAYLREWKEELAHPVTVKIKDICINK